MANCDMILSNQEEKELQQWYKKRKHNLIVYFVYKALYSFEMSAISISALYYFQYILKVDSPKLYYSLAIGALSFMSMFSTAFVSRYMDRCRCLRKATLIGWSNVVGNILYVLPFYGWLPILGRFICGIGDGIPPAYQGELTRTYTPKEISKPINEVQTLGIIFHALGPVSSIMFQWVDFKMFGFVFNQYNFVAVFLTFCTIIYQTMAYFMLSDLTKEPGYQIFLKINHMTDDFTADSKSSKKTQINLISMSDVCTNMDILMLLATGALSHFTFCQGDLVINMVAVDVFHWSIQHLSILTVLSIIIIVVTMRFFKKFKSNIDFYFITVTLLLCNSIVMTIVTLLAGYNLGNSTLESALVLIAISLNILACYSISGFVTITLSLVVPVHSRCSIMGIRNVLLMLAFCAGFFTASSFFNIADVAFPILSISCLALCYVHLARSRRFINFYC